MTFYWQKVDASAVTSLPRFALRVSEKHLMCQACVRRRVLCSLVKFSVLCSSVQCVVQFSSVCCAVRFSSVSGRRLLRFGPYCVMSDLAFVMFLLLKREVEL